MESSFITLREKKYFTLKQFYVVAVHQFNAVLKQRIAQKNVHFPLVQFTAIYCYMLSWNVRLCQWIPSGLFSEKVFYKLQFGLVKRLNNRLVFSLTVIFLLIDVIPE